jgi:putative endonuclease
MPKNISLGKIGEELATQYLKNKGYHILERNWRAYRKEIDIIAIDGKDIVFVEVKTRKSDDYGTPEMAVNREKRAHIFAAASSYYYKNKISLDVRFDIVSVLYQNGKPFINHIVDAFHSI